MVLMNKLFLEIVTFCAFLFVKEYTILYDRKTLFPCSRMHCFFLGGKSVTDGADQSRDSRSAGETAGVILLAY